MIQLFSINAKTCTLKYNNQQGNATVLGNDTIYVIPIYQRPYSWTEEQIRKFIADIYESFWGFETNTPSEPMFIGTMQLSFKNEKNEQDIIDGQQRLTTFLLLIKVLKYRFKDCEELHKIGLDWLHTRVNNGKQQTYLEAALLSEIGFNNEALNPYIKNLSLINNLIDEQINEDESRLHLFDINTFIRHLLTNVYFVIIETRAGLSKTLQIFNAINTTGLDLNGGDIFKIRMYEYLKDKKGMSEKSFEEISNLYQKIDDYNEQIGEHVTNITDILSIYKYVLIARHALPTTLYNYGTDSFFEQLFDTILGNYNHDYFKHNVDNVELSLTDIEKIIEVRYEWEHKWRSKKGFTAETACCMYFIWWSRYSKYWQLTFVLFYRFSGEASCWDRLLEFNKQLAKMFFIFSVRFQKLKSDIYYGFMYKVISALINESFSEVMTLINNKIGNEEDHNGGWYDLNWFLTENLTENAKRKNLICRMSAMLCEDYTSSNVLFIKNITKRLFETDIDIEHIQSYHDRNGEKREDIWNEWDSNINSLGNLMILERKINRSINNSDYEIKMVRYHQSIFSIVRNQCNNYPQWDLSKCVERKEIEKNKILNYIFS